MVAGGKDSVHIITETILMASLRRMRSDLGACFASGGVGHPHIPQKVNAPSETVFGTNEEPDGRSFASTMACNFPDTGLNF